MFRALRTYIIVSIFVEQLDRHRGVQQRMVQFKT